MRSLKKTFQKKRFGGYYRNFTNINNSSKFKDEPGNMIGIQVLHHMPCVRTY